MPLDYSAKEPSTLAVGEGFEPPRGDSVIDKRSLTLLVNRLSITYFLTLTLETKGHVCQFHHPTEFPRLS